MRRWARETWPLWLWLAGMLVLLELCACRPTESRALIEVGSHTFECLQVGGFIDCKEVCQ